MYNQPASARTHVLRRCTHEPAPAFPYNDMPSGAGFDGHNVTIVDRQACAAQFTRTGTTNAYDSCIARKHEYESPDRGNDDICVSRWLHLESHRCCQREVAAAPYC